MSRPKKPDSPAARLHTPEAKRKADEGRKRAGVFRRGEPKGGTHRTRVQDSRLVAGQEEEFCQQYVRLGFTVPAGKIAFPNRAKSMKPEPFRVWLSKILARERVRDRIAQIRDAAAKGAILDLTDALLQARRLAFFDPADLFNEDGSLRPIHEIPRDARLVLSSIQIETKIGDDGVTPVAVTKIRFPERNAALDKVFRYLGLYQRDNEQRRPVNLDELRRKAEIAARVLGYIRPALPALPAGSGGTGAGAVAGPVESRSGNGSGESGGVH